MPRIIVLPFVSSNTSLPVLSLAEPPILMPEIWNGLQFWFDSAYVSGWTTGAYAADHAVVDWRNHNYVQMMDASSRLSWVEGAVGPYKFAQRHANLPISPANGFPSFASDSANLINGRPSILTIGGGQVMLLYGDPTDLVAAAGATSADYTIAIAYKCTAGAVGGLYGQRESNTNSDATAGQRFGFTSGTNGGNTLYQHKSAGANQLLIARDTANDLPTLAIIRCSLVGAAYVGTVRLVNNGVTTDHAFSFTENIPDVIAGNVTRPAFGNLNTVGEASTHRISLVARMSRKISDTEQTYLTAWMQANRGPF
ncbi:MAG: hypothetical protein Q8Q81_00385 [Oxalobacteraceae bacterium]|nr:hypothetical protein [Oxalobacteraceae bacterium]